MRLSGAATQGEGKRNHPLARNCQPALSTLSSSGLGTGLSSCFLGPRAVAQRLLRSSRERALIMQTYAKPTMYGSNGEPACMRMGIMRMDSRGFTFTELMLVVAIIGILSVLAAPTLFASIQTAPLQPAAPHPPHP